MGRNSNRSDPSRYGITLPPDRRITIHNAQRKLYPGLTDYQIRAVMLNQIRLSNHQNRPLPPPVEKPLPPRNSPWAFAYTRVSTSKQAESRLSTNENSRLAMEHARYKGLNLADRIYIDAMSAYKVPFFHRPAAKELMKIIRQGDHLIITKGDRAFRNMLECLNVVHDLHRRGIIVHMLDAPVDVTTEIGQLLLAIMAWCAQWESSRKSERMCDAHRAAIAMGRPMRKFPPIGFRWVGGGQNRRLRLSDEERAIFKMIWKMRYDDHLSLYDVWRELKNRGITVPHMNIPEPYTYSRVIKSLAREREFRRIEELSEEPLDDASLGGLWLNAQCERLDKAREKRRLRREGKLPKGKNGRPFGSVNTVPVVKKNRRNGHSK